MEVQESWIKNSTLYFSKECSSFFPVDCFGARGKPEQARWPAKGVPVTLDFGSVKVETDIAMGDGGRIRPRDIKGVRRFYADSAAIAGDFVVVTRTAPRAFQLRLVKG